MPKRKSSKSKPSKLEITSGISHRSFETLKAKAGKARKRIQAFTKRKDAFNYFLPDASDYTLEALVQRFINGESLRSIYKEVDNVTAANIRSGVSPAFQTKAGYKLTTREASALKSAVDTANRNIRAARKKFSDPIFKDVLPEEFNLEDVKQNLTTGKSVANKINDLQVFTPDKLVPIAINETGEAGTQAEYEYTRGILERENERRAKIREMNDPEKHKGRFMQGSEYDAKPIDIDSIKTLDKLRKRSTTWDDSARLYRANLYLKNYSDSMKLFETIMRMNGYMNDTIAERLEYIQDVISRLYYDEDAITYISNRMPELSMEVASPADLTLIGKFDEIYQGWINAEEMFLE